jgi:anti-anti-sigma factor
MGLKVRVTQDRSFARTVHLDGRLDHESVVDLDSELDKLAGQPVDVLVFDLADLEYISSAGLRSIFAARKAMSERDGRIVLLNARPQVQKVFDIVKAADLAAVFTSVQELDRYLDAMQRKVVRGE